LLLENFIQLGRGSKEDGCGRISVYLGVGNNRGGG